MVRCCDDDRCASCVVDALRVAMLPSACVAMFWVRSMLRRCCDLASCAMLLLCLMLPRGLRVVAAARHVIVCCGDRCCVAV